MPFSASPELGTSVPIEQRRVLATVAPVSGSRATVFAAEHAVVVTGVVQRGDVDARRLARGPTAPAGTSSC